MFTEVERPYYSEASRYFPGFLKNIKVTIFVNSTLLGTSLPNPFPSLPLPSCHLLVRGRCPCVQCPVGREGVHGDRGHEGDVDSAEKRGALWGAFPLHSLWISLSLRIHVLISFESTLCRLIFNHV